MTTNNVADENDEKKHSFKEYYDMGKKMVKEDIEKEDPAKDVNKD